MATKETLERARNEVLAELREPEDTNLIKMQAKTISGLLQGTVSLIRSLAKESSEVSSEALLELASTLPSVWAAIIEGTYNAALKDSKGKPGKASKGVSKTTAYTRSVGSPSDWKDKPDSTLLTTKEACGFLEISYGQLGYAKKAGRFPKGIPGPYQKSPTKYRLADLRVYKESGGEVLAAPRQTEIAGTSPDKKSKPAKKTTPRKKPAKPQLRKSKVLSGNEAAEYLGINRKLLAAWRKKGKGPKFTQKGEGKGARVTYRLADLKAYKDSLEE